MPTFNVLDTDKAIPAKTRRFIDALIARAMRRELAMARASGVQLSRPRKRLRHLRVQLAMALLRRGAARPDSVSVRRVSPSTGGRSFHFHHSSVSCVRLPTKGKSKRPAGSPQKHAAGRRGRAGAHMRYVERGTALEIETSGQPEVEALPATDGITASVAVAVAVAVAGQRYMEDPVKVLDRGSSFGSIGPTLEERVAFWELLEQHERNADCRVQERLILELPHEASSRARREMVQEFCCEFERLGLPYWAALHAPGPQNDRRNYHAHIAYSTRPARRMMDPADGQETWDFAIVEEYRSSSRNRKFRHPHRQRRCAQMTRKGTINAMRWRFAAIVTAICERDGVRDAAGRPVRYDPRSHDAMGVGAPVMPLRHRTATHAREGSAAVPDGGQTRATLDAVRDVAAWRRDRALVAVAEADQARKTTAEATAEWRRRRRPDPASGTDRSDVEMWIAMPGVMAERLTLDQSAGHGREADERSDRAALTRLVEATSPEAAARPASKVLAADGRSPELDADMLSSLHAAARAEAEDYEAEVEAAWRRHRTREALSSVLWRGAADGPDDAPVSLSLRSSGHPAEAGARRSERRGETTMPSAVPGPTMDALAAMRERLPDVLGIMDRALATLRAMPIASRLQVLARPLTPDTLADLLTSAAQSTAAVEEKTISEAAPEFATAATETSAKLTTPVSVEVPMAETATTEAAAIDGPPMPVAPGAGDRVVVGRPGEVERGVPVHGDRTRSEAVIPIVIEAEGPVAPRRATAGPARPPQRREQRSPEPSGGERPPAVPPEPVDDASERTLPGRPSTQAGSPAPEPRPSRKPDLEKPGSVTERRSTPRSDGAEVDDTARARARRKAILSARAKGGGGRRH